MVVGRGDSEDLRLRPGPEPRVKDKNGHNKEQADQGCAQRVDDQGLLELISIEDDVPTTVGVGYYEFVATKANGEWEFSRWTPKLDMELE